MARAIVPGYLIVNKRMFDNGKLHDPKPINKNKNM